MAGPSRDKRKDSRKEFLNHQQAQASMAARQSRPMVFSEPLTEANLNRCAQTHQNKGKARETSGLREEDSSGVVRTAKGAVRAAPYPRRALGETRAQSLAAEQQSDAQQMGGLTMDQMRRMHVPSTAKYEYIKKAEEVLADIGQRKGPEEAAQVRMGLDLLNCYNVMKRKNVDFLTNALLEHLSQSSHWSNSQMVPLTQASGRPAPLNSPLVPGPQALSSHLIPGPQASGSKLKILANILPPPDQSASTTPLDSALFFFRVFKPDSSSG
ncbi:hypothetical protein PtA15_15A150 [Puccinia triticina]|uniref:Uncharacterized protein n=1 Tax=Puccinia triticina TaxID=208348 RepID=A0ABY7D3R0_9BASI|nr:uncharacterized protein PtA15_15A150 [Puccinia triticina]WAQ91758.1 hypothetical protein PtA15_15A150 [Puccinia triticina]